MRTSAQVCKVSLGVKCDVSIIQPINQLQFVLVTFFGKVLNGV